MRNKSIMMFMVMMLAAASAFAAPDRVNRLDIGVNGGGAFPDGDLDSNGYVGASISYGITQYIAIGVEGGWFESDTDALNSESVGVGNVMGDIIVRHPGLHDTLVPYGVLGLGYAGAYVTNDSGTSRNLQGDDIDDGGFAWKLGAGLDWFVTNNIVLNVEGAFNNVDVDFPATHTAVDEVDYWTLVGGVKIVF